MLTFNLLLKAANLDPKNVYLVRHKDTRVAKGFLRARGSSPYQLWATQPEKFETYQRLQADDCFGRRNWIASYVVTPADQTLFVGMYRKYGLAKFPSRLCESPVSGKLVSAKTHIYYDLLRDDLLSDWAGRVVIDWGPGYRSWIQTADAKGSGDKKILEIRAGIREESFPGYREFRCDLKAIKSVWPTWQQELKHVRGIYLLTCKDHGEQYVGKADGFDGFWGRFCQYTNGHGGNEGMKPHATTGYMVTLLEAVGTVPPGELERLEAVWKDKLGTRRWGLNKN